MPEKGEIKKERWFTAGEYVRRMALGLGLIAVGILGTVHTKEVPDEVKEKGFANVPMIDLAERAVSTGAVIGGGLMTLAVTAVQLGGVKVKEGKSE